LAERKAIEALLILDGKDRSMKQLGWTAALLGVALAWYGLAPVSADDKKGTVVDLDGLKSTAPADWKEEEPSNRMRYAQFKLPPKEGDKEPAELVIFKGLGGSSKQNIQRWKDQFVPPDGKTIDDVSKVAEFKVKGQDAFYLDVAGTYKFKFPPFDPNAKEQRKANYRMLAIHFEGPKEVYHIKLTGPAKTVEAAKKGFEEWFKAFK
jgi:hypothetical protein